MGKVKNRLVAKNVVVVIMLLVGIATLPATLIGGESVSGMANQARKAQDPEKMQKALHGLIQKAKSQQAQMQQWHRTARLAKAKAQAQERQGLAETNGVTEAWRKFCQARLAMSRTSDGVTAPVSMRLLDSCSTGTNFSLNGH